MSTRPGLRLGTNFAPWMAFWCPDLGPKLDPNQDPKMQPNKEHFYICRPNTVKTQNLFSLRKILT